MKESVDYGTGEWSRLPALEDTPPQIPDTNKEKTHQTDKTQQEGENRETQGNREEHSCTMTISFTLGFFLCHSSSAVLKVYLILFY